MCKHLCSRVKMIWLLLPSHWTCPLRTHPENVATGLLTPLKWRAGGEPCAAPPLRFLQFIPSDCVVGLLPLTLDSPIPQRTPLQEGSQIPKMCSGLVS